MIEPLRSLVRSPRAGAPAVLARGSLFAALLLIGIATALSATLAYRTLTETTANELYFGPTRHPLVTLMLDSLGRERTSVILYLVERSFEAVVTVSALSPLFVWLLGSTSVHAAARLAGIARPFGPMFVFFAYATALALVPSNAAALALGGGGVAGTVASLIGVICLVWLGLLVFRGIEAHYAVAGGRAVGVLVVAIVLFYLVPFLLIIAAAVAIVVAAIVLGYF